MMKKHVQRGGTSLLLSLVLAMVGQVCSPGAATPGTCWLLRPGVLCLRGGSIGRGVAAAQQVELADSPQEAAAVLVTCTAAEMGFFSSPAAIDRALAGMRVVKDGPRARKMLPTLVQNAKLHMHLWRTGRGLARTLRLLADLHLHLSASVSLVGEPGAEGDGHAVPLYICIPVHM